MTQQNEIVNDPNLQEELKKLKKENINSIETINRMVDHILSQPSITKAIGISDEIN